MRPGAAGLPTAAAVGWWRRAAVTPTWRSGSPTATLLAAATRRHVDAHFGPRPASRFVGVLGGAFGMLLSRGAVAATNGWVKTMGINRTDLIQFDGTMAALALGLSLLAGLVAGVYPAWRVCCIAPAVHPKPQ